MRRGGPTSRPPALITSLLARVLPEGPVGRSILGDLREEWHGRPAGAMRVVWYAWEAVALATRYGTTRLRAALSDLGIDLIRGMGRLASAPGATAVTALAVHWGWRWASTTR